ncbi:RHS repeat-associated protein [Variovorax boronicumulans]|uniref:RHS repeat-associated core domain-containing protein n=1 Tax=Variovorax boronicumulans TaxID=436515 RepID=UPI002782B463|nr:RHS repeat-associated core domain-containing protein [Variovorax boronicumulans]MDP9995174.1 RHS repeat-associated protein [Variovorax boronicumulans]MDQ0006464.1 RHS repeat-associated protein [Variovorax boronicumulans]
MTFDVDAVRGSRLRARIKRLALYSASALALLGASGWAQAGCSLNFTSPAKGAKVTSPNITVYGSGGGDATTGDAGTVTATLNGSAFFNYSGSFTAVVSFLEGRGVPVTLRPGPNYLAVSGSVGGCGASDFMTVYYDTTDLAPRKNKGDGTERNGPQSCAGNPINFAMGIKVQEEEDFRGASTHYPLRFARVFNSVDGYWRYSYATRLRVTASEVVLLHANGRESPFARSGSTITPDPDELGTLSQNGTGWRYVDADNTQYEFNASGRLTKQTHPYGWAHTLTYGANGAVTVADGFGNSLSFTEDAHLQPLSLTTPNFSVAYNYDAQNRLTSAVKTAGADVKTRTYHYENTTYPRFLTGVTDESGARYATYAYDTLGRAISTTHAGNAELTQVAYNANGTTTVTDSVGRATTYHYVIVNGVKRISQIQGEPAPGCPASNSSFTYDTRGLLSSQTNATGSVTNFTYNTRGLEASRTEAVGTPEQRAIATTWDTALPVPTLLSQAGKDVSYTYDTVGKLLTETVADTGGTSGAARTSQRTYTPEGWVQTYTEANGAVTTYAYDTRGNVSSATNALGHVTAYTYDAANRLTSQTDPNGLVTTFVWDAFDRLLSRTVGTGPGQTTTFTYHPAGTLATISLPTGLVASYTYDAAQRLTGWSNNRGESGVYTLDAAGNRLTEQILNGSSAVAWTTARTVNKLNRIATQTEGASQSESFAYDANGDRIAQTNGLNQSTSWSLDALRRVKTVTDAANASASLGYNALDAVTQASDFKAAATNYNRDALGNATSEASADSGARSQQYDSLGLPSQIVDALGQATTITRDALGRPTALVFADGKTTTLRYDLTANSKGYLSEIIDRSGTTEYTRDVFGRVTLKKQTLANGSIQQVSYAYNPSGTLVSIGYPNGATLAYIYDTTGRLSTLNWNGSQLVTGVAWNPLGQPTGWTWAFASPQLSGSRSYDTAGRLTATEAGSYVYDAAGRITSLTQYLYGPADSDPTHDTIAGANVTWSVGYDSVGRITSFDATGNTAGFGYDTNGNRTSSTRTLSGQTTARSYSVATGSNRLAGFNQTAGGTATTVVYGYNANGDLVGDGLRSYGYDAEGRLSTATTGATDVSPTTRYAHNALGQRVFKTEPLYPPSQGDEADPGFMQSLIAFFTKLWSPSTTQAEQLGYAYVYDEQGTLIAEVGSGGTNSAGQAQYIYLPTDNGPMPVAAVINGTTYAVHSDHLNTPRRLTNASGQAVWQWGYSAFGEDKPTLAKTRFANLEMTPSPGTTSISEVKFNLRYPGQYADEESGLFYNYFRSYDARTGRYSQPDPIGLDGGWNRFGYVDASPLSLVDPRGLNPKYEKPPNPNKRPPPDHRVPSGERERNVGHPEGEEHGTKSKKQRGSGLKGARGARGVGGLLIWDIINGICDESPGTGGCEVINPPPPPPHEQLCLKDESGDDIERKAL